MVCSVSVGNFNNVCFFCGIGIIRARYVWILTLFFTLLLAVRFFDTDSTGMTGLSTAQTHKQQYNVCVLYLMVWSFTWYDIGIIDKGKAGL